MVRRKPVTWVARCDERSDRDPSNRLRRILSGPVRAGAAVAVAGLVLAACSSSSSSTTTSSPPTTASSTSSTAASTQSGSVKNLPVTDAVRTQLIAARAAQLGIAPSTFTGMAPGTTYYAYDSATNTYWAAGSMAVPNPTTMPATDSDLYKAQVASQDAGAYLVFSQPSGGSWAVTGVGSTGPDSPCAVTVPAGVAAAWGWPAGSCRPTGQ